LIVAFTPLPVSKLRIKLFKHGMVAAISETQSSVCWKIIAYARPTPGLSLDSDWIHAFMQRLVNITSGRRNAKTATTCILSTTDIWSCQVKYPGMTTRTSSVMASITTTTLYRSMIEGHTCDEVLGATLSGEHPTETKNGTANVQATTAAMTTLQSTHALLMSRVNSLCTRRIVDNLESPRDM
jgi:hypothetical protein